MRILSAVLVALALTSISLPSAAQTTPRPATSDTQIRETVAAFWKALGDLDAVGLKATLDWPNALVETQPDRLTSAATINTDAATLEAEIRRSLEGLRGGRKGDFFGTTVSVVEVRFVNSTLAYARHVCRLGGQAGERSQSRRGSRDFESIAVLRATGDAVDRWKIVLIAVPK